MTGGVERETETQTWVDKSGCRHGALQICCSRARGPLSQRVLTILMVRSLSFYIPKGRHVTCIDKFKQTTIMCVLLIVKYNQRNQFGRYRQSRYIRILYRRGRGQRQRLKPHDTILGWRGWPGSGGPRRPVRTCPNKTQTATSRASLELDVDVRPDRPPVRNNRSQPADATSCRPGG